jgi:hypothetical protein
LNLSVAHRAGRGGDERDGHDRRTLRAARLPQEGQGRQIKEDTRIKAYTDEEKKVAVAN